MGLALLNLAALAACALLGPSVVLDAATRAAGPAGPVVRKAAVDSARAVVRAAPASALFRTNRAGDDAASSTSDIRASP